jgi:integrase/recombinase XerD
MPLNVTVRHTPTCLDGIPAENGKKAKPGLRTKKLTPKELAVYRYCDCPKYFHGHHEGKYYPRTSLKARTWEEAEKALEKVKRGDQPTDGTPVAEVVAGWLGEVKQRGAGVGKKGGVAASTLTQWTNISNKLLAFCAKRRITIIRELGPKAINEWRAEWQTEQTNRGKGIAYNTALGRIEVLKLIFKFAMRMRYLTENPIVQVDFGKHDVEDDEDHQTMPLDEEGNANYRKLLKGIPKYLNQGRQRYGIITSKPDHVVALTELMYETGLRISDATMFLLDDVIVNEKGWGIYTTKQIKTKKLVTVGIPPELLKKLQALPRISLNYLFYDPRVVFHTYYRQLWNLLRDVGASVGIEEMRPHRLRDSFAVNRLNEEHFIQDVSLMLGHKSVAITERYYAPFVKSRQANLMAKRAALHSDPPTMPEKAIVVPIRKRHVG